MSDSIRLHKKYGLNPTLPVCFYCGEETGEIALLGAGYNGEAPMHLCINVEPCPKCREKYKDYVLLVETTQNGAGERQPTGRWLAIRKECVTVPNDGVCYTDVSTFNQLVKKAG